MKKTTEKGFTLIELLAVIVILGIIAVIAIPVVKNTIDEAKKKSFINSAYGIIKAGDLYYSRKDMMDEIDGNMIFTFPDNVEELELQGKLPKGGTIIISETGDISIAISNKDYCITKGFSDKEITLTEDVENCKNPALPNTLTDLATTSTEVTSIPECITNNTTCTSGTPVAIKVNESEIYNFYVISETDNKVTLIMDRNLGDKVAWYKDEDDTTNTEQNNLGPITAVSALKERTARWTNIPEKEYTYSDDGGGNKYIAFKETMRARMLTNTEATVTLECTTTSGSCPSWLYSNLSSSNTLAQPYGYWTSAASASTIAISIINDGRVNYTNGVHLETLRGVRPVIELTK